MIIVMNCIGVKLEFVVQFEESFCNCVGLVDGMFGFICNEVFKFIKFGDFYIVLIYWQDEFFFCVWIEFDEFKQGYVCSGSFFYDVFIGCLVFEVYDVLLSSDN